MKPNKYERKKLSFCIAKSPAMIDVAGLIFEYPATAPWTVLTCTWPLAA